jgi:hypothetical protein
MSPILTSRSMQVPGMFATLAGDSSFAFLAYTSGSTTYRSFDRVAASDNNAYIAAIFRSSGGASSGDVILGKINHKTKTIEYFKQLYQGRDFYRGISTGGISVDNSENIYGVWNTDPMFSLRESYENRCAIFKFNSSGSVVAANEFGIDGKTQTSLSEGKEVGSSLWLAGHSNAGSQGLWLNISKSDLSRTWKQLNVSGAEGQYLHGSPRNYLSSQQKQVIGTIIIVGGSLQPFMYNYMDSSGNASGAYQLNWGTSGAGYCGDILNDSSDNIIFVGTNGSYGCITKVSSNSVSWSRNFSTSNSIIYLPPRGVVDSTNNTYAVWHERYATSPDRYYTHLVKYNSAGSLQWQRKFESNNDGLLLSSIDIKNDILHLSGYMGNNNGAKALYIKLTTTSAPTAQTVTFSSGDTMTISNGTGSDSSNSPSISGSSRAFQTPTGYVQALTPPVNTPTYTTLSKDITA